MLAMSELLEREADLAVLRDAIGRLRDNGEGGAVLIEGPPGIGKSALLAAALAEVGDLPVARAQGSELESGLAFGAVRQLLAPLVRRLPAEEQAKLFDGPARLAARVLGYADGSDAGLSDPLFGLHWLTADLAERAPCVFAVDDLHWIDEESGRFVAYLARRLEGVPLLLVATARPGEPGREGANLPADRVVRPGPLTVRAVARIVPGRDAGAAHRATGGNPLLALELARAPHEIALDEVAPAAVGRGVLERVARVSDPAVALARAVSLFPAGASLQAAAAVADLAPDGAATAADGLVAAHVFAPGDQLAFLHPVMRTAVYEQLGGHERRRGHGRAASVLHEHGAAEAAVVEHLMLAAPAADPESIRILSRAADAALDAAAPRAAVRFLERALAEPIPPGSERAATLHRLGRLQAMLLRPEGAETLREAVEAAVDPAQRADAAVDLAVVLVQNRAGDEAIALLSSLVGVSELDGERALLLDGVLAGCAYEAGDSEVLNAVIDRLPDDMAGDTIGQQLAMKWKLLDRLQRGAPVAELVEQVEAMVPDDGVAPFNEFGSAMADVGVELLQFGRFDLLERIAEQRAAAARARGREAEYLSAIRMLGVARAFRGEWHAAEEHFNAVLAHPDAPRELVGSVLDLLTEILAHQGRFDEADAALERYAQTQSWEPAVRTRRALIAEIRGDYGQFEVFKELPDFYATLRMDHPLHQRWLCNYAEGLGRHGRADEGIGVLDAYLEGAEAFGDPLPIGHAHLILGRLKRGPAARAHFERAVALLDPTPYGWFRAQARLELGAALRRDGRRVEAREHLRLALDYAERHGSVLVAERAREELRLSGARLRSTFVSGAESLTPAEARIARLAAAGRSNREIASELFLTVGTVKMTLVKVFRKLDVGARGDLADALAAHP
ncbi:MAG: hypothetical protein QOI80_3772 [Solirubrobacteraceae bacterium]|nr:hypothetical protein [Solirubrobacteraceae bacterium]